MLFAIQALSGLAAQTPEVLFIAGGFGKRRFRPHRTSISRVFGGQAALLLVSFAATALRRGRSEANHEPSPIAINTDGTLESTSASPVWPRPIARHDHLNSTIHTTGYNESNANGAAAFTRSRPRGPSAAIDMTLATRIAG